MFWNKLNNVESDYLEWYLNRNEQVFRNADGDKMDVRGVAFEKIAVFDNSGNIDPQKLNLTRHV